MDSRYGFYLYTTRMSDGRMVCSLGFDKIVMSEATLTDLRVHAGRKEGLIITFGFWKMGFMQ